MALQFDHSRILETMVAATEQTFAELAFMDAVQIGDDLLNLSNPQSSQMLIHHPFCGEIELIADDNLLIKMAENILMIEAENLSVEQKNDILSELLNTVSGRILAQLLPENQTFKLGLPENTESFIDRTGDLSVSCNFSIDDSYQCKITFLAEFGKV